jgi:hypothetical protein
MVEMVKWTVARLREPSSYAGLAGVLTAFHIADAQSWANVLTTLFVGAAGVLAMVLKEKRFGQ